MEEAYDRIVVEGLTPDERDELVQILRKYSDDVKVDPSREWLAGAIAATGLVFQILWSHRKEIKEGAEAAMALVGLGRKLLQSRSAEQQQAVRLLILPGSELARGIDPLRDSPEKVREYIRTRISQR
jgi:hypothetical protein